MKVLIIGIDALDRILLDDLSDQLPNFSALKQDATMLKVRSTFPPDSDTAWATIMTGLNPAQHGIVKFVDPLEKVDRILHVGSDNEALQGLTFWELIGQAGYNAHAIFPHLCYPIWDTPGIMVARGSKQVNGQLIHGAQSHPPEILDNYPNQETLFGTGGFPGRGMDGMKSYVKKLTDLTRSDSDFALELMAQIEWDLYFFYLSTLDAASHFFWNYYDKDDPGFIEGHPFQKVIPDLYRQYDEILGQFLAAVDDDVTVIILSDHGHGARPFNLVNVNEVLSLAGFLKARDLRLNPHLNMFEKTKRAGVKFVSRYGLAKIAGKILRNVPFVKESLTRPSTINWDETIAYASDMSGIKAYTYGGVIINKDALGNRDYEKTRSEIIALLQEKCVHPDGSSLINFIAKREDVYTGPYVTSFPDIILEFKYRYGVGWAVNCPLITFADSYNLVPGSHRGETGVFIMRSPRNINKQFVNLLDITPTLLDLMGIDHQYDFDGTSILVSQNNIGKHNL